MVRVPHHVITILPQLQDLMQQIEENGEDSREVILQVFGDIEERLSNWYWAPESDAIV